MYLWKVWVRRLDRKLILVRLHGKILTALLENGKVCELHCDEEKRDSLLGNIYVGKVRNIVSNIQAAFPHPQKHLQRLKDILSYLQEHASEELSLEDIAAHAGLCKSECCRFFKKYMRMTI